MTAFNFLISPDMATVVTDTLNTVGPEQRPYLFSTKVHVLTHLHAVMGGKGRGLFLEECYRKISLGFIARDVADVDNMVSEVYRRLWVEQLATRKATMSPIRYRRQLPFITLDGLKVRGGWLVSNTVPPTILKATG